MSTPETKVKLRLSNLIKDMKKEAYRVHKQAVIWDMPVIQNGYGRRGVADKLILCRGVPLFVEVKAGDKPVAAAQKAVGLDVFAAGGLVMRLSDSLESFTAVYTLLRTLVHSDNIHTDVYSLRPALQSQWEALKTQG